MHRLYLQTCVDKEPAKINKAITLTEYFCSPVGEQLLKPPQLYITDLY